MYGMFSYIWIIYGINVTVVDMPYMDHLHMDLRGIFVGFMYLDDLYGFYMDFTWILYGFYMICMIFR